MLVRRPRVSGATTATVGTAWLSVQELSRATTTAASAIAASAAMRRPRRETTGGGAVGSSGDMGHSVPQGRLRALAPVRKAEHHRHEHQRRNRRKNEATDDRPAERRILLAPL